MLETFVVFLLLMLIPFLPGILELYLKKDIKPLDIRQDYSKDPAFFGKSFAKIFMESLKKDPKVISEDTVLITISSDKQEIVKIYKDLVSGKILDQLLYAEGQEVKTEGYVESNKEAVINGNFIVLHPVSVRALLVRGDLVVKNELNVARWIHVSGKVQIESKSMSYLGINLFAKEILLKGPCKFKRLYAQRIEIGTNANKETKEMPNYIKGTLRSKGSINIKSEDKNLIIDGNLISDEDILVEGKVWIRGNVFSHTGVVLLREATVGEDGKIRSVVGKKRVVLGNGVKVYGYVHTDGEGVVEL